MRFFAQVVSILFHPLFYPLYILIYILYLPVYAMQRYNDEFKWYLIAFVFVSNVLLPLLSMLLMKRYKLIDNMEVHKAQQRYLPFALMFTLYVFSAFSLNRIPGMHPIIIWAFASSASIVALVAGLNPFLKVSAHAAASGAAMSWTLLLFYTFEVNTMLPLVITTFILGLVMSARLILHAHKSAEVWVGAFVGIMIPLCLLFLQF
jgi:hypothetical protein